MPNTHGTVQGEGGAEHLSTSGTTKTLSLGGLMSFN